MPGSSLNNIQYLDKSSAQMLTDSKIDHRLQLKIIENIMQEKAAKLQTPKDQSYPFWLAKSVRSLDLNSVPPNYRQQKYSQLDYLFRHHPNSNWQWHDDETVEILRPIINKYQKYFKMMTRVKIHLQEPGSNVPLHRDLTAGQYYHLRNNLSTELGNNYIKYQMYNWVDLNDFNFYEPNQERNYFSLKIPLSTDPANYGLQFIRHGKQIANYKTNGNLYFLNENHFHGASAVSFVRGLVFIDGILNDFKDLESEMRLIQITQTNSQS